MLTSEVDDCIQNFREAIEAELVVRIGGFAGVEVRSRTGGLIRIPLLDSEALPTFVEGTITGCAIGGDCDTCPSLCKPSVAKYRVELTGVEMIDGKMTASYEVVGA